MPAKVKAKQAKVIAKKDENQHMTVPARSASRSLPQAPPKVLLPSPAKPTQSAKPAKTVPAKQSAPAASKAVPAKKAAIAPAQPAPKRNAPAGKAVPVGSGVKKTKSQEQIVKVVTKGLAAVDSLVPGKEAYCVLQEGRQIFSATLNQSNLSDNNNKFYILQVLLNEASGQLFFWSRWGRVGVSGQNALLGPMPKENCLREFARKLSDKTVKGDYREIEIKYEEEKEAAV